MKIKVDKKDYEKLVERVDDLEAKIERAEDYAEYFGKTIREELDHFFENKVRTYIVKRDKDEIIAELREQAINNIFKEQSK